MDDNTKKPPKSSGVAPAGVYDIDELRLQCRMIGVIPKRSSIRRYRRALDLLNHGSVMFDCSDQHFDFYRVNSQTYPDTVYHVRKNGSVECNCPDALKGNQCKHHMAVLLYIAKYN